MVEFINVSINIFLRLFKSPVGRNDRLFRCFYSFFLAVISSGSEKSVNVCRFDFLLFTRDFPSAFQVAGMTRMIKTILKQYHFSLCALRLCGYKKLIRKFDTTLSVTYLCFFLCCKDNIFFYKTRTFCDFFLQF